MNRALILARDEAPHFTCGLLVDASGAVVDAAPIMRWAIGKPLAAVRAWVLSKGGAIR